MNFLEARRKKQEKRGGASLWLHLVKHRENLVLHCAPTPSIITLFNPIKHDVFTFFEERRKKQEKRGGASLWLHLVKHRENLVLHCAPNPTINHKKSCSYNRAASIFKV